MPGATAIILIVVWVIAILGYSIERGILKSRSSNGNDKKANTTLQLMEMDFRWESHKD